MREWLHYPADMRNPTGYAITAFIVVLVLGTATLDAIGFWAYFHS